MTPDKKGSRELSSREQGIKNQKKCALWDTSSLQKKIFFALAQ